MSQENHTRRDLFRSLPAAMAAATANAAPAQDANQRPNIVIIFSDQFRWDCVGAAGLNPMNLTPNLDEMARRGTSPKPAT